MMYTADDIIEMRKIVIGWRDASLGQWDNPAAIQFTVDATHLIAMLQEVIDEMQSQ